MTRKTSSLPFRIHGMDCAEEIAVLRREVGPVAGGEERLSFNLLQGTMVVEDPGGLLERSAIEDAIARTGMRAELVRDDAASERTERFWNRRGRLLFTVASGVFAATGFATHVFLAGSVAQAIGSEGLGHGHHPPPVVLGLYLLGILTGGFHVAPKAWLAARRLRPDMNLLMTLAVIGALVIGEAFEAATVSFLFALSLTLEAWSVGRARRAVAALLDLSPPTIRTRGDDGKEVETLPQLVPVGTRFIVLPGERIPLDGEVVAGASAVNQAPITGESQPVAKGIGDQVFAGTINGAGALEVRSTRRHEDTTLAAIVRLVRGAQAKRATSEQWVDRFARVYTPSVMALSVAVAVLPPLLLHAPASEWFYRALVLLVIACPCALVISTPVSVVAGLASAARQGVLIKGGLFLEIPARLRAIVFDKTGTLTLGHPEVSQVVPFGSHNEREVLARAAAMESRSTHPLARAIVVAAKNRGIEVQPAEDLVTFPGKGASGRFDGSSYWLGSHRYLEERGQETADAHRQLEAMAATGMSVVVVGTDDHVCGLIGVTDPVRPGVREVVRELRGSGIGHLSMLSGDNAPTVAFVARETTMDEYAGELLPQDKVGAVESLVSRFQVVAMVGDGVNDAPAMARASIGIAMGAVGSDAAIETADIALMADDLTRLPWLIHHSRRVNRIIRQNIAFSLVVKGVFVALTFAGAATLWSAIAADMGASLLVIFNGLRLLRGDEPPA